MTTQELIATYTYTGDVITLLIGISLLVVISTSMYYSEDRSFVLFRRALILVVLGAFANIAFAQACVRMPQNFLLIIALRDVYHLCLLSALVVFIFYIRDMLNFKSTVRAALSNCTHIVFGVGLVSDLLAPVFKYSFYYEDGLWVDSTYAKPFSLVYIYAMFVLAYMLLFSETRMIKQLRSLLILCAGIDTIILIVENMQDSNSYTSITFILPLLVVFVMVHTQPYDFVTGALPAESLQNYLGQVKKRKMKTHYVILELKMDVHQKMPYEMGKAIHSAWYNAFKRTSLFCISKGTYILAINNENSTEVRSKISYIIENKFKPYYGNYRIPFKLLALVDADFITNEDALLGAVSYLLGQMEYNSIHTTTEEEIGKLKKYYLILQQLVDIKSKRDLNDSRILAYCQPVKNAATGKFDTAEVLMRMELPEIGFVFPDEFIPLAEEYQYIHDLSLIILNKACKAVKELMSEGYSFHRISVNFSISELRENTFCDEVLQIIEDNGIPYEKIAIELTESQNDSDFQLVEAKIKTLRKHGIQFYLDDFGTGYSNFERLIRMKLDIIKFDRSLLLYGESDKAVSYTLKHFAEAFHELGFKVLFEGLENDIQEELCHTCKADYLQGYKYSKPIPIADYRKFLTKDEDER